MAEKNIKSRIIHKHDSDANFKKATGFAPLSGELVIYDADENNELPKIKIGDGKTNINDLKFIDDNKVDKVEGKGLSTNDYTTAEKNKLAGIATGANKTVVDSALSSTSTNPVQNKVVNTAISDLKSLVGDTSVSSQISSAISTKANTSDLTSHTGNTTVHITSTERTNWNAAKTHADSAHAPSNAEANQNAFSNVTVGSTTVAADSKTDTLTLAGSNVTLTPDATNDKITIGITKTNVTDALGYTPPTTNTTYGAAGTSLGLVKSGGDVTISSGTITVNDDSHNHVISNVDGLQDALDAKGSASDVSNLKTLVGDTSVSSQITSAIANKADKTHTHNYAGSASAGGSATSAVKLDSSAGSTTQPIYFSEGKPVATTYSLGKSVPSNAVFTDTNDKVTNTLATTSKAYVTGTTSTSTNTGTQVFDTGVYLGTTAGELVASKFTGTENILTGMGRNGHWYQNILEFNSRDTVDEIVIKTKIPFTNGNSMIPIYIKGYAYGESSPIDLTLAFYIYNNAFCNMGCTSTCPWKPTIYLSTYTENSTKYVAITLNKSIYFLRFSVSILDIWSTTYRDDYARNWTIESQLKGENDSIIPQTDIATVPYKKIANNISGNADTATSATKATQDGSGNNIVNTYATKTALNSVSSLIGDKSVSTQISEAIASKSDTGHTHDDRYYTETEINNKLSGKSDTSHTHSSYVNQNAFSNVKVGSSTIAADSATDTLTLTAGNNVTLTADTSGDGVTIAAKDTVYTHPTTSGNKHIPSGGSSGQILRWSADGTAAWGADKDTTYSNATTSAAGLMSSSDKTKLDGIATGATKVTVDSALSSTSTNPVQNKVVNTAISNVKTLVGDTLVSTQISNAISSKADLVDGKVPSSQLPSYVDDVLEYNGKSNFPSTGETGKIYVDTATNLTYRWGGSAYVEISPSLALGETSSTAYRGDRGKVAYDHSQKAHAPSNAEVNQNAFSNVKVGTTTVAADSKTDTLELVAGTNVTLTPDATNDKVTIAAKDTTYSAATTSTAGLMSASDKTKLDGIATGANKTIVDSALSATSTNPVQNKTVNTAITNLNTLVGDTSVSNQINTALANNQSDWNQNNETATNYIKNRPFYSIGYSSSTLLDGTFTFAKDDNFGYSYVFDNDISLKENREYTVIFDGIQYNCMSYMSANGIVVGNGSILGVEGGNNEPFGMFSYLIATSSTQSSHVIKITTMVEDIQQLDKKYLPELDYLSKDNPNGTGSFSLNRSPDTEVGELSFAVGNCPTASGIYSHAEGDFTTASGYNSHAEGASTIASGYESHAEGNWTQALGDRSHTEGNNTIASGDNQHVQGKYNISDTTFAHIVGNGTSTSDRSNAHTLDWNGNAWFAGNVTVGSGKKTLATTDLIPTSLPANGGNADTAGKLNSSAGDSNTPVYFSGGKPVACTSLDLNTSGNAATATKATQDGSGNNIVNTYATKTALTAVSNLVGDASVSSQITSALTSYEPKSNVTSKGSATQPVYFDSNGVAQPTTYTLGKSVPSNAVFTDTDTKVTQTAVTTSGYTNWRPLVIGSSNSNTEGFSPSTVTDTTITANTLSCQPSSGTIKANTFKGNATTATKATQDGSGNNIVNTYATKTALTAVSDLVGDTSVASQIEAAKYTHPSYTARTGVPTANQTPAFGGSFSVNQITSDATGHVTAANSRSVTIPSTLSNGTGTAGLIKTSSTVTSNSGYTACPVISGVPYYKDTNTTYTLNSFGITATATELNYCDGVSSNIQTQLNSKLNYSEVAGTPTVNPLTVAYGGTGATTSEAALANLGVVSYIIEEYTDSSTSLNWVITKWSNGRAEARTKSFVETGNLTMTAIGNNYYSNNLTWTLPPGLFVDNTYNVSTEIQSSGSPINTIRQSISTKDEYVCRIQKSNNTTTSVSVKFLVIGRWK